MFPGMEMRNRVQRFQMNRPEREKCSGRETPDLSVKQRRNREQRQKSEYQRLPPLCIASCGVCFLLLRNCRSHCGIGGNIDGARGEVDYLQLLGPEVEPRELRRRNDK